MKQNPPSRLDNLLRPDVLAAFDRAFFEREGYWVWKGVLTDEGRAQWSASLQKLQALNDTVVRHSDWCAVDYQSRGISDPDPEKITNEFLAACTGGSEQMKFMPPELREYMYQQGIFDPALATDGFDWQGIFPEYFPLAYDDFILDIATVHPQMMALFAKVLGPRFLIDHVLMLNRTPGSRGRRWHGHPYRQGQHEIEDPIDGGATPIADYLHQQCVRTLCYPEGMGLHDGGGELAVVPGAHLYRVPYRWSTARPDYDDTFEAGWLKGKVHAFNSEPLRIEKLSLPPGSMVSFGHHMPHHVGHRDDTAETRWGLLMAYRTPDPTAAPARWNEGTPPHWAERMENAGALTPAMRQIFEGDLAP